MKIYLKIFSTDYLDEAEELLERQLTKADPFMSDFVPEEYRGGFSPGLVPDLSNIYSPRYAFFYFFNKKKLFSHVLNSFSGVGTPFGSIRGCRGESLLIEIFIFIYLPFFEISMSFKKEMLTRTLWKSTSTLRRRRRR